MINFKVQDNFIITDKKIIAVFEIEPIDVILLTETEQQSFEIDIKRTLNNLGDSSIQIVMRTRKAEPKDMDKHFRDISTQQLKFKNAKSEEITSKLIQGYVSELSSLLENNIIPVKEYYLVFSVEGSTKNQSKLVESIKKLERNVERVTNNLHRTGIETKQVTNYDVYKEGEEEKINETRRLENLVKSFVRL